MEFKVKFEDKKGEKPVEHMTLRAFVDKKDPFFRVHKSINEIRALLRGWQRVEDKQIIAYYDNK